MNNSSLTLPLVQLISTHEVGLLFTWGTVDQLPVMGNPILTKFMFELAKHQISQQLVYESEQPSTHGLWTDIRTVYRFESLDDHCFIEFNGISTSNLDVFTGWKFVTQQEQVIVVYK